MSKLTRTLVAGATLAAISLAGMTTVAHAQATEQPTRHHARPPTQGQVGEAWHQHRVTSHRETPADATVRRLLARERSTIPNQPSARVPAPAPNQPNRQRSWVLVSFGVLAVLVLAVGLAVLATRRASRRIWPRAASLTR